jgi:hypothetical protein
MLLVVSGEVGLVEEAEDMAELSEVLAGTELISLLELADSVGVEKIDDQISELDELGTVVTTPELE